MSLLTCGGKSLGIVEIGSDCTVDDKGHMQSGYKHGSFRGGVGSFGLSLNACTWVNFARLMATLE